MVEQKYVQNGLDHMTKMVAMPIYCKNLKNIHLLNQKADDIETWYAAFGTHVLSSIYDKVKVGPLCFCMRKSKNNGFFRNYCSL